MSEDLKSLKSTYRMMKSMGDEAREQFLDGIVSYCRFLGWDREKTLMMLGLVRNFIPEPGEKFTDCDLNDEFDNKYTKKILDSVEFTQ